MTAMGSCASKSSRVTNGKKSASRKDGGINMNRNDRAQCSVGKRVAALLLGGAMLATVGVASANESIVRKVSGVPDSKQIYVTGKGYGTTNLTIWGREDQVIAVFDLDVGVDLVRLKQHLAELLPE